MNECGLCQRRIASGNGCKNNKNDKIWFYRWISVPRNLFMMMSSNSKAITGHLNSWHDWFFFLAVYCRLFHLPSDAKQQQPRWTNTLPYLHSLFLLLLTCFFLHLIIIIIQQRSMPSSYNCWDIKYGCVLYCIVLCSIVLSRRCVCVFDCGQYACVCVGAGQTHKFIRSNILKRIYSMRCKNVTDKIPLYKMVGTKVAIGPFPSTLNANIFLFPPQMTFGCHRICVVRSNIIVTLDG